MRGIRGKGRHKLRDLLIEAIVVCEKYEHREYLGDIKAILFGLNHDAVMEATAAKAEAAVLAKQEGGE